MSTLKNYFELVVESFQSEPAIWTPGWWYLTVNKAVEELKKESSATDMFHYENLKTLIHKVTRLWSNCSSKWEITSLENFFQKTGPSLASTFRTSFSSEIIENVMCCISILLNKETLSVETCSDSALMTIMSTSSIPALLVAPNANAAGGKRSRADSLSLDTDLNDNFGFGEETTLSQQSYISSTKNGVTVKRGLVEDVKDYKVIVSTENPLKYLTIF